MDVYPALYLPPGGDPRDPRVSPLFARDLSRLPAALIVTADADPLRDEAALYAQRLIAAGNVVGYRPFRGQIHGFLQMAGMIDDARAALDLIAAAVRAA
jgi:acetyl esterase